MHLVVALADAPTAVIAVVAILLGLFVVARGQRGDRGERGERREEEAPPSLFAVPVAPPGSADAPQQLETMAVHDIGQGTIRLGGVASSHADPAAEPPGLQEPATPVEPPEGHVASQDAAPEPVSPSSPEPGAAAAPASEQPEPAPSRVPFRQRKIRLRKPRGQ